MENSRETEGLQNPCNGGQEEREKEDNPNSSSKPKIVVIMGPTGSGKSKLAIDLASHFPIEIINADSMQVYQGLDVLTNKVPAQDQKGVPHHLLGTISPDVEFTAKDFRDYAIPLINEIWSRNRLPVVVGGTNYYIQALVSQFLLDDSVEDVDESCLSDQPGNKLSDSELEVEGKNFSYNFDCLKDLDPVAANRIHPNDHRKIKQYLCMYARSGVLPSKLLQETSMQNWGNADSFRYICCFICVDASLPALDRYVEQRVDHMVNAGLLNEVYDIYNLNANYTRGLRQAIGVREFEDFLRVYTCGANSIDGYCFQMSSNDNCKMLKGNVWEFLNASKENQQNLLLNDAIDKVKVNTRRLVRRQKRRLSRLQTLFGWDINSVDSTDSLAGTSNDLWAAHVVEPSVRIIKSFLDKDASAALDSVARKGTQALKLIQRDLWTQYVCKACGDRVLRGAHEWEQHRQGRGHRKRISRLRKLEVSAL
ncbi:unnamed protein product [Ilex paraguariensis]|uniref:tRNA dimethylallyltransferase 2 n=1 Tax=Ilex paraguariensis TaxID=185542 RepID=A0ABC8S9E5_9AQUA